MWRGGEKGAEEHARCHNGDEDLDEFLETAVAVERDEEGGEGGVKDLEVYSWQASAAPKGLPADVRKKLEAELIARVRERLSPHLAPRAIEPIDALPMTATGKIMRRELKRRALEG